MQPRVLLLLLALLLFPLPAKAAGPMPTSCPELSQWLAASEAAIPDITPGTEKTIVWQTPDAPAKTAISVIYLHGFTATRQESAPLPEMVADALGANLFYTRLRGHGRPGEALLEGDRVTWKADTLEALAVGEIIGEQVVILGLSTGSTLATWLATEPLGQDVLAYVLISPNWGIDAAGANLVTLPGGRGLVKVLAGRERDWTDNATEEQQIYWTTRYSSSALVPMMRLVRDTRRLDLGDITQPVLVLYSPKDKVISPTAVVDGFAEMKGSNKELQEVHTSTAEYQHVLTGRILSPENLQDMTDRILTFLEPFLPPN